MCTCVLAARHLRTPAKLERLPHSQYTRAGVGESYLDTRTHTQTTGQFRPKFQVHRADANTPTRSANTDAHRTEDGRRRADGDRRAFARCVCQRAGRPERLRRPIRQDPRIASRVPLFCAQISAESCDRGTGNLVIARDSQNYAFRKSCLNPQRVHTLAQV